MVHSQALSSSLPVFVNKALLEQSHAHYLYVILASFMLQVGVSNFDKEHMFYKAKNIYYLPLHGNRFFFSLL